MATFPEKQPGDVLGASHVNFLTAGAEKALGIRKRGSSSPSDIRTFTVIAEGCDDNADHYRIAHRYWDNTDNTWKVGDGAGGVGFALDPTDSGQSYAVGDTVLAYYDSQRGAYIPLITGSGAPRIRFTILSADFTVGFGALGCDHVVVIVNHVSCGGTGVAVGDEVRVYDPEYCHFNLPLELLIGLSGTATWMKSENYLVGLDYFDYCIAELRAAGCMWMIDTLCCAEEENLNG